MLVSSDGVEIEVTEASKKNILAKNRKDLAAKLTKVVWKLKETAGSAKKETAAEATKKPKK